MAELFELAAVDRNTCKTETGIYTSPYCRGIPELGTDNVFKRILKNIPGQAVKKIIFFQLS